MPIAFDSDRVFVPPNVVARAVGDRMVLLNTATGRYFALDSTGARIWNLVEQGPAVALLCASLLSEFEADPETLRRDLASLLDRLESLDLVEIRRG